MRTRSFIFFCIISTTLYAAAQQQGDASSRDNNSSQDNSSSRSDQLPLCSTARAGEACRKDATSSDQRGLEITGQDGGSSGGNSSDNSVDRNGNAGRQQDDALRQTMQPPEAEPEPAQPSEFQQFIAESIGHNLPLFGYQFFRNVPSTFAPFDRAPASDDYVVGPGDELLIRAWGQIDVNYKAVVSRNGDIYLPKVGEISVNGLRYRELQPAIKSAIARFYKDFQLTVTLGQMRSIQVFVVGHARRPGAYTVSSLSTLVNTLFASGGPSTSGSMRRIQLKRGSNVVTEFDMYDLLLKGDKSKDVVLQPGDVIYIPAVGPVAAVTGRVNAPAIFELRSATALQDVLSYAGGLAVTAANQRVLVERISDRGARQMEEISVDEHGLARNIVNGDLVRVLPISEKFENAVTLRGNVAVPGRFPWHEGMRLKDLIPDTRALITQQYWMEQNRITRSMDNSRASAPAPVMTPEQVERKRQNPHLVTRDRDQQSNAAADNSDTGADVFSLEHSAAALEINWQYALVQRVNEKDLTSEFIPVNLANAIKNASSEDNVLLEPGDVVTVFSQSNLPPPMAKQSKYVRMEGEFVNPGVYKVSPTETVRSLVARIGGVTDDAYLFGAEFTRESIRKEQQLRLDEFVNRLEGEVERNASGRSQAVLSPDEAAALSAQVDSQRRLVTKMRSIRAQGRLVLDIPARDATLNNMPDLVLEDGDRLYIPHRLSTVNVLGSVYNDTAMMYDAKKRMMDYLRSAGGGTREADVRRTYVIRANGSVISRGFSTNLFTSGFDSIHLMPGDTIVVPERLNRTSVLRGLRDWSQVMSQFALGAAAAQVLR